MVAASAPKTCVPTGYSTTCYQNLQLRWVTRP
jgi:hypothetical protein